MVKKLKEKYKEVEEAIQGVSPIITLAGEDVKKELDKKKKE